MARPTVELADIVRLHGAAYRQKQSLPLEHKRVLRAIEICRTAALGGHVDKCSHCDYQRISYNSCRNRHCPKCQNAERLRWLQRRQAELLPVEYHHVVFTIPTALSSLALQNKRAVYGILFQAASETLLRIGRDPKHLGAELGFFAILHTWGQNLLHHPHVHCVVPGGGPSLCGKRWVRCRPGFLLPVRVLSRLFRRLFLEALQCAFQRSLLQFHGDLQGLAEARRFLRFVARLRITDWVVYSKPPFGGPQQALAYLGRYTHRVAISNERLLSTDSSGVSFRWKDYRNHNASKTMTLAGDEFIRRFLLHALPKGFQRIRHFGWLANRHRAAKLALCRRLLESEVTAMLPASDQTLAPALELLSRDQPRRCPSCQFGVLIRSTLAAQPFVLAAVDSS